MKTISLLLFFAALLHAKEAPNFVFLITDDISPTDLGPYGNEFVKTPNLDRLSERALVFEQAYLTISSCSPSRCSIITGRYPHNTGAPELHTTLPADQKTFVQALQKAGYHTVLSGKNHMGKPLQLGFDESSDSYPAGSEKWLQHLRDRPKDQPFFFWFASHDAHHGWTLNEKAPVYDPATIPVPPMLYDGPETRSELAKYYHEVSRTDHYAGLILDELKAQGIADNTYFIYCSDNGRPFPRCKTYLYDSGIKTPLIISGPEVKTGRTTSLVSSIDFSATILDLAGIPKLPTIQGVSFRSILTDPTSTTRDLVFSERNWHVYQNHARSVRLGDWLYVWNAFPDRHNVSGESSNFMYPTVRELWKAAEEGKLTPAQALLTKPTQPAEMLFNVKDDPHQFINLAGESTHYQTLGEMRRHLADWTDQTGDNVPINPTPDRQPLHEKYNKGPKRGDFAGAKNKAEKINNPGPIKITTNTQTYDLIILAGQSNAVGFDAKPTELPQDPADKKVLLWWKIGDPPPDTHDSSSNAWLPLAPQPLGNPAPKDSAPRQYGNFAQADGGFGPEIGFARHLLKIDPDRKIAVLKVAFSGTSIPQDWDPTKRDQKDSCYAALLAEFQRAREFATKNDLVLRPSSFLWVQGESDANPERASAYATHLTDLLKALRQDLKTPKLPALIAVNTHFGAGKNPHMPAIVAAQKQVSKSDPLTTYVDTSSAPIANPAHFSTEGTLQVGQLFAEAFLRVTK